MIWPPALRRLSSMLLALLILRLATLLLRRLTKAGPPPAPDTASSSPSAPKTASGPSSEHRADRNSSHPSVSPTLIGRSGLETVQEGCRRRHVETGGSPALSGLWSSCPSVGSASCDATMAAHRPLRSISSW